MTTYSHAIEQFDFDEMVAVTRRLSELIDNDLVQLRSMRIGKLQDSHEEKLQLANLLEGYKAALKADPSLLKNLSRQAIEEARKEAQTFETKLKESHTQLKKAHTAHGAILELIRSVVLERSAPARGYGRNGTLTSEKAHYKHTPPINLDERI